MTGARAREDGCRMPPDDEMLGLSEDVERLADIGDLILAGASISEFGLTENERHFVTGYVRGALGEEPPEPGGQGL